MDGLRIEIFTPREKRAAAALTVAVLLLAGSVLYVTRPAGGPSTAATAHGTVAAPPYQGYAGFWFLSPTNAFAIAGTTHGSIYRSLDGGGSWRQLSLPAGVRGADSLQPLAGGELLMAATRSSAIAPDDYWLSPDGGTDWRRFPVPSRAGEGNLRLLDARTGVLVSRGRSSANAGLPLAVYWTHDGGATWLQTLQLDEGNPAAGALVATSPYLTPTFADDRRGWTMSGSFVARPGEPRPALLRTTDAGHSWSEVALPPPPARTFILNAPEFPNGGRHGYLALQGPSGLMLYESTDGGDSWSEPYTAPVAWFSVSADRWVSSEGRTLLISRDWGRSWSSITGRLPRPDLLLGRVGAAGQVLWSYHDGDLPSDTSADSEVLLRSTDGGRNWIQVRWPGA